MSLDALLDRCGVSSSTLRRFDIYAKIEEDFQVKTTCGAALSLIGWLIIVFLMFSEISTFMNVTPREHMAVDTSLQTKLTVYVNISFHSLTCAEVQLDAMDVAGYNQVNIEHDVVKRRLSHFDGSVIGSPVTSLVGDRLTETEKKKAAELPPLPKNYCGSCYGAENAGIKCCNNCEELKLAYKQHGWSTRNIVRNATQCLRDVHNPWTVVTPGEGCRIEGHMDVNKVAGNLHVAHGESIVRDGRHIHQFIPEEAPSFNISHTVHELSFGGDVRKWWGEGLGLPSNPLDNTRRIMSHEKGTGLYQYFIKVIPTQYTDEWGRTIISNSYTMTERFRPLSTRSGNTVLPGVFFIYDIQPFAKMISKQRIPLIHLLTRLMAITGGVFVLLGCIDTLIYTSQKMISGAKK
jgi:endoplasmic reticulum-Golgi intermediate compartment protein 3